MIYTLSRDVGGYLYDVFVTRFDFWLAFGMASQLVFTARFLVQWIASERARKSIVPVAFWYFSLAGGITLLAYAIHRRDPVFILGQSMGVLIYLRNLWLIHAETRNA